MVSPSPYTLPFPPVYPILDVRHHITWGQLSGSRQRKRYFWLEEQEKRSLKLTGSGENPFYILPSTVLLSPSPQASPRHWWSQQWQQWQWWQQSPKILRGIFLFDQRSCNGASAVNTPLYSDQDVGSVVVEYMTKQDEAPAFRPGDHEESPRELESTEKMVKTEEQEKETRQSSIPWNTA